MALAQSGMRKAKLAELAAVQQGTLTRYFAGDRAKPDYDVVSRIADVLGVEPSWLMEGRPPYSRSQQEPPPYVPAATIADAIRRYPYRWGATARKQAAALEQSGATRDDWIPMLDVLDGQRLIADTVPTSATARERTKTRIRPGDRSSGKHRRAKR